LGDRDERNRCARSIRAGRGLTPARGLGQAPGEQQHSPRTVYLSLLTSLLLIHGFYFLFTQLPHRHSLRSSMTQHSSRSDVREVPIFGFRSSISFLRRMSIHNSTTAQILRRVNRSYYPVITQLDTGSILMISR